jgi:hypothetical protein
MHRKMSYSLVVAHWSDYREEQTYSIPPEAKLSSLAGAKGKGGQQSRAKELTKIFVA